MRKIGVVAFAVMGLLGPWMASSALAEDEQLDELMAEVCGVDPSHPVELMDEETQTLLWAGPAGEACAYLQAHYEELAPIGGDVLAGDVACQKQRINTAGGMIKGWKCTSTTCSKGGSAGTCKTKRTTFPLDGHRIEFSCPCDVPPPPSDLFSSPLLALGTLGVGTLLIGTARSRARSHVELA